MAWARWRTVAGATLVALVLVGCSGDDAGTSQEDVADDAAPPVDGDGRGGEGAADAPSGDEEADRGTTWPGGARAASGGRQVVRSAEIVLEVDDSAQAASEVEDLAERVGGFVAESDLRRDEDGVVEGTLTLRVPSDALASTVADLDELALAVPVRRVDERDVTAEVTDLEAELTNLTAYEAELRALLTEVREQTSRPEDLLSVFDRINAVRSEIERTQARLAVLEDQVAMARIDVTLRPAVSATPVTDPGWAPGDTLRGPWPRPHGPWPGSRTWPSAWW